MLSEHFFQDQNIKTTVWKFFCFNEEKAGPPSGKPGPH